MRAVWVGAILGLLFAVQMAQAGTVLVVGDSISAGFGLDSRQGWVDLLENRLQEQGFAHRVINASISGDTSAAGAARLPALLAAHHPEWVIIELGGNDGLRGLPPSQLQQNLTDMVRRSQKAGARVLILGMRIPPNYGVRYTTAFAAVFAEVANATGAALLPFLLEGAAGTVSMMQDDGVHPNASAQPLLLDNVWPSLQPLL